ncbi:MAG TPA: TraR/DksA family transcriptional regulator [Candidatus Binatia bacterium]|jgi:RNA polymerase-binding transcription factor DksA|nr:TraR/DksA family transcriptional regulator [Candidatus Binatia bacterium]
MDEIRNRLERELSLTMGRLRQIGGGGVAVDDMTGGVGDSATLADEGDLVRLNADREMSFATRSLLVERANRIGEALERLRDGDYGTCQECGEAIAPARLRAMPEVTTCVRCQDRLERNGYPLQPVGAGLGGDEGDDDS